MPIALLFPLLLWLAARCQPVFAAAAAFIVALTIVWTTTFGIGYFGDPDLPISDRIVGAQAGILTTSLCTLVLAALFAERRQQEAALSEGAARLEQALAAGAVIAFEWDARTGLSHHSENAANILGYDPQAPLTTAHFLALIHPDDRAHFKAHVKSVRPDKPSYAVDLSRDAPRRPGNVARGNSNGRVRRSREMRTHQGPDPSTSRNASELTSTSACWSQSLTTASKMCLRALAWSPCIRDRAATRWTNISKHLISASKAWQLHMSC